MAEMKTQIDIELDEVYSCIEKAITHLSNIIVGQCDGYDEISVDHHRRILQSFYALIELRDVMKQYRK